MGKETETAVGIVLKEGLKKAVIVDVDGTLVNVSSIRHHVRKALKPDGTYTKKNFDAFHKESIDCPAIWSTLDKVHSFWSMERCDILIVTARGEPYRKTTEKWLEKYAVPCTELFMRKEKDYRADVDVKRDIYKEIQDRNRWKVVYAIDDNPSIVRLWQDLGIYVFVVPGWED